MLLVIGLVGKKMLATSEQSNVALVHFSKHFCTVVALGNIASVINTIAVLNAVAALGIVAALVA
jgi:hypothetical protein